jgi:hypothetical protein
MPQVDWFWTWGGRSFGYREADALFSYEGRHVGQFAEGEEIYGHDGAYLGEVRNVSRLITNLSKKAWRRGGFSPMAGRGLDQHTDMTAKDMPNGFKDFPVPGLFV